MDSESNPRYSKAIQNFRKSILNYHGSSLQPKTVKKEVKGNNIVEIGKTVYNTIFNAVREVRKLVPFKIDRNVYLYLIFYKPGSVIDIRKEEVKHYYSLLKQSLMNEAMKPVEKAINTTKKPLTIKGLVRQNLKKMYNKVYDRFDYHSTSSDCLIKNKSHSKQQENADSEDIKVDSSISLNNNIQVNQQAQAVSKRTVKRTALFSSKNNEFIIRKSQKKDRRQSNNSINSNKESFLINPDMQLIMSKRGYVDNKQNNLSFSSNKNYFFKSFIGKKPKKLKSVNRTTNKHHSKETTKKDKQKRFNSIDYVKRVKDINQMLTKINKEKEERIRKRAIREQRKLDESNSLAREEHLRRTEQIKKENQEKIREIKERLLFLQELKKNRKTRELRKKQKYMIKSIVRCSQDKLTKLDTVKSKKQIIYTPKKNKNDENTNQEHNIENDSEFYQERIKNFSNKVRLSNSGLREQTKDRPKLIVNRNNHKQASNQSNFLKNEIDRIYVTKKSLLKQQVKLDREDVLKPWKESNHLNH